MYITPFDYGEWFIAAALPDEDDHRGEGAGDWMADAPAAPHVDWETQPRAGWSVFERARAAFRRTAAPDTANRPDC